MILNSKMRKLKKMKTIRKMNNELLDRTEALQQSTHEQISEVIRQTNNPKNCSHQDIMNVMLLKEIVKLQSELPLT